MTMFPVIDPSKYDTPFEVQELKKIDNGSGGIFEKWVAKIPEVWGKFRFTDGSTYNLGGGKASQSDAIIEFHAEHDIQPDDVIVVDGQRYRLDGPANEKNLWRSEKSITVTRDDREGSKTNVSAS